MLLTVTVGVQAAAPALAAVIVGAQASPEPREPSDGTLAPAPAGSPTSAAGGASPGEADPGRVISGEATGEKAAPDAPAAAQEPVAADSADGAVTEVASAAAGSPTPVVPPPMTGSPMTGSPMTGSPEGGSARVTGPPPQLRQRITQLQARLDALEGRGGSIGESIRQRVLNLAPGTIAPAPEGAAPSAPAFALPAQQGWALPVAGKITDGFGARPDAPVAGVSPFHGAVDLAASCGTPVYAAADGTVTEAGRVGSYGNWILLDQGSGVQTGYAHNSALLVSAGDRVVAGQQIALVGSTGASTGCHLHYETRVNGAKVDPVPFMRMRGIALG